jgi:hypothetical protein
MLLAGAGAAQVIKQAIVCPEYAVGNEIAIPIRVSGRRAHSP